MFKTVSPSGDYERQKGYGYVKKYGRDFCKEQDKSKCVDHHQPEYKHDDEYIQESNAKEAKNLEPAIRSHYQSNGVLNLKTPNLEFDSSSSSAKLSPNLNSNLNSESLDSKSSTGLIPTSDELNTNKKDDVEYIRKIYNLNKDAVLPENVNLNLITAKLSTPRTSYLIDNFNLNDKILDGMSSNSVKSNTANKGDRNYESNMDHLNLNDESTNKESDKSPKAIKQNSQLIDTLKKPVFLASDHYEHYDDEDHSYEEHDQPYVEHSYHHTGAYHKHYNHDRFAERLDLPKIVHSAAKQLRKHHYHHKDYRSSNHYKTADYEDDNLDSHLLGATRLQPKFIKTSSSLKRALLSLPENLNYKLSTNRNLTKNLTEHITENNLLNKPVNSTTSNASAYGNSIDQTTSKNKRKKRTIDWLRRF